MYDVIFQVTMSHIIVLVTESHVIVQVTMSHVIVQVTMPESEMLIRPKMTRATYQALKRYILKERERKKQGKAQKILSFL